MSAIRFTLIIALSIFMRFRNNACYHRWSAGNGGKERSSGFAPTNSISCISAARSCGADRGGRQPQADRAEDHRLVEQQVGLA
jgi:hypothetical protein